MPENKDKQSAYGALKNLINNPTQKKVFGSGGLFGYQKEDHKVLEIFASYAYWQTKDDGNVPVTLDSENFINYLITLPELNPEEKEKIIGKIENLRHEGAIRDKPLAENTLRNFAILLGDLEIGGNPELISIKYEDALDKAIAFHVPTGTGGNVTEGEKPGKTASQSISGSENPETTVSQPIPGTEKSASESKEGKSEMEAAAKVENKDQTKIELKKEETEETENNYQQSSQKIDQKPPEKEKQPEKTEKPEVKTDMPVKEEGEKIAVKKTESELEDTELRPDQPQKISGEVTATRPIVPVYQRLIFSKPQTGKTGKFAKPSRISQMESALGTLRKASKTKVPAREKSPKMEGSDDETAKNQAIPRFKDIPLIPLARGGGTRADQAPAERQSSGPSSAKRLAKLAGAGVAGGSILPFFAGGGHAEAATYTMNYLEKLLKFIF